MWRSVDPDGWVPLVSLEVSLGKAKFGHISESVTRRLLDVHTLFNNWGSAWTTAYLFISAFLITILLSHC